MDVIESQSIKVPNSILISGLTGTQVDEELVEFLQEYGSISRTVQVDSSDPDFQNTTIVEFQFGTAIKALQGKLPCQRPTCDPRVTHTIQLLSPLYSTKLSSGITQTYLANLKGVAKLSGTDYEQILLKELSNIQKSTDGEEAVLSEEPSPDADGVAPVSPDQTQAHQVTPTPQPATKSNLYASTAAKSPVPLLSPEQIQTPEVQRVIVEHIVKSSDLSQTYPSPSKLKLFSGKSPCPNMEVDYETWHSNVEFYLADSSIPERQVVRKMIESLLPPAANIVKHLGPLSSPHDFLSLLDSAYGTVDDVDELFAKFLNTNQNAGENPSAYLHRLQTTLSKVLKGGGIPASDFDRQLLKQFCRGCWNNSLISSLQLEQKKCSPPPFSELLLLLRTEEDKQAAKSNRMKQHLGLTKLKVQSNPLNVYPDVDMAATSDDTTHTVTNKLQKQIAQLQEQLTSLRASLGESVPKRSNTALPKPKKSKPSETKTESRPQWSESVSKNNKKPRAWYCFNCGDDGHIATSCTSEPNPDAVETKRKALRAKQKAWEEQARPTLN
ncbi:zinc finger CCHC domain-containing protein 12-like [Amphiprion ocellaris]|uniref:zinc finger CCHC domain-containing protein 12-like n=1 Tax=Amphiprion ocellaris TaxID=80972 RepID=UPI001649F2AD|nr:zinc finger CCHC domain-containing protein 12-like [Amphiprion ocellaris]